MLLSIEAFHAINIAIGIAAEEEPEMVEFVDDDTVADIDYDEDDAITKEEE